MKRLLALLAVLLVGIAAAGVAYNALRPNTPTCSGPITTPQADVWRCPAGATMRWTLDQHHPYASIGDPNGRQQLWVFVHSTPDVPAIVTASGQFVDRRFKLSGNTVAFGAWTASGQQFVELKVLQPATLYATIWKQRMG